MMWRGHCPEPQQLLNNNPRKTWYSEAQQTQQDVARQQDHKSTQSKSSVSRL
jgi:hypothetical protein